MTRKMKDSGVEWIGVIPEEWKTDKVKYLSKLNGRIGWQGLTSNEYQDEGPYLITGTDFINGRINWDKCVHITNERYQEAKQIQIENGDLLITKDGTVGKVAIVTNLKNKASLNSGVLLIRPLKNDQYDTKYLYYILISDVFWMWFESTKSGNSTIIHLYQEKFKEFSYPLPELIKQKVISNYLDKKCSQIEETIEKEKQVIEKLKAYKQSVITEAVTKGLNPDVPMKDTGLKYIGAMPNHWQCVDFRRFVTLKQGLQIAQANRFYEDGPNRYIYITLKYINSGNNEDAEYIENPDNGVMCDTDDILFVRTGSTGLIVTSVKGVYHNNFFKIIYDKKYLIKEYLLYYLSQNIIQEHFKLLAGTTTIPDLNHGDFLSTKVVLPSVEEQEKIIVYLDKKCSNMDNTITQKETLIQKLNDYKKSLIYECITGKREV